MSTSRTSRFCILTLLVVLSCSLVGCVAAKIGWTSNQYKGHWWVVSPNDSAAQSGNAYLQLQMQANKNLRKFVKSKGALPDYIYVDDLFTMRLFYVTDGQTKRGVVYTWNTRQTVDALQGRGGVQAPSNQDWAALPKEPESPRALRPSAPPQKGKNTGPTTATVPKQPPVGPAAIPQTQSKNEQQPVQPRGVDKPASVDRVACPPVAPLPWQIPYDRRLTPEVAQTPVPRVDALPVPVPAKTAPPAPAADSFPAKLALPLKEGSPVQVLKAAQTWLGDAKAHPVSIIAAAAAQIRSGQSPQTALAAMQAHLVADRQCFSAANGLDQAWALQAQKIAAQVAEVEQMAAKAGSDPSLKQQYMDAANVAAKNAEQFQLCREKLTILGKRIDDAIRKSAQWETFYESTSEVTGAGAARNKLLGMMGEEAASWLK